MRLKRRSTFQSIFLMALALIVISIGSNFLVMQQVRGRIIQQQTNEQGHSIDTYAEFIDTIFQNSDNIVSYISHTAAFRRLGRGTSRDAVGRNRDISDLRGVLSSFVVNLEEVDDLFLLLDGDPYLHTKEGLTLPQTYFDNRYAGEYEEWKGTLEADYRTLYLYRMRGKSDPATSAYPSSTLFLIRTLWLDGRRVGNAVIMLNESFISHIVERSGDTMGRRLYLLDGAGEVLTGTSLSLAELPFSAEEAVSMTDGDRFFGGKGLLSSRAASISGTRYLMYTPEDGITAPTDQAFLTFNLILVGIFALLVLCAYLASRHVSRPFTAIAELLEEQFSESSPVVPERAETEFIKQQITRIVAANSRLHGTVRHNLSLVLESMLFKMLLGDPSAKDTLKQLDEADLQLEFGLYNTWVIRIDMKREQDELFFTQYRSGLLRAIADSAGERLLSVINTRQDEYVAVLRCEKNDGEEAGLTLEELEGKLNREIPEAVFFLGEGTPTPGLTGLRGCYRQALHRIGDCGVKEKNAPAAGWQTPLDLETVLLERFEDGNAAHLQRYIEGMIGQAYEANVTIDQYTRLCRSINNFLLRIASAKKPQCQPRLLQIDGSMRFYSPESLSEILCSNAQILCDGDDGEPSSMLERILQFVDLHFTESINLMSVAFELGYHPDYLSRFFKQRKGINFTDYVNQKRIGHAKQLLTETKKTIKQIGAESGFNSSNLLIRTFAKYEGITPGEYRAMKTHGR